MFDGRLEHFEDFRHKVKACFLELGPDEITFKPHVDVVAARDKLVKAVESKSAARSQRKRRIWHTHSLPLSTGRLHKL